jgi:hypothetical protein
LARKKRSDSGHKTGSFSSCLRIGIYVRSAATDLGVLPPWLGVGELGLRSRDFRNDAELDDGVDEAGRPK